MSFLVIVLSLSFTPFDVVTQILTFKISKGEVNNPRNKFKIHIAYTKSTEGQHGLPTKVRVGSGAMEE